jgi:hypothetical protein
VLDKGVGGTVLLEERLDAVDDCHAARLTDRTPASQAGSRGGTAGLPECG